MTSKTTDMRQRVIEAGTPVIIDEYLPASHSLKIRKLSDGKPITENIDTTEEIVRSKSYEKKNNKVLKTLAAEDAPIIEVSDDEASMRGSSSNGFYSYREAGNIVTGPTSFTAQPHEIRISGVQTLHPLLLSGFPSTILTPIPVLQWSLPTGDMLAPIVKDIALISTLLGVV